MRVTMNAMPEQGTNTLRTEAADTATDLDNIIRPGELKNSYPKNIATRKVFCIRRQPQDFWRGNYCGGQDQD